MKNGTTYDDVYGTLQQIAKEIEPPTQYQVARNPFGLA